MYRILLALALGYAIKENISKLISVEGGIGAFETVHWIIVALTVVMIPLCVYTFIYGWREYNDNQRQKKEEAEEQANRLSDEKFGDLAGAPDEEGETPDAAESDEPVQESGSKYDT